MLARLALLTTMRDCGNGLGRASLLGFDSQPATPVAGQTVSTWIAYDLPSPSITGGVVTYSYKLNGLPFPPTTKPLCDDTSCPKAIGFNNETSTAPFPSGVSGKIVGAIQWNDQTDTLVWCVETTWKV